jgi:hypothetical protein
MACAVSLALATSAQAGESFLVGEGKQPHLTVDPAGAAHVVWVREDVGFDETHYCRVPRGATACDAQATLLTSAIAESPTDTGTPFILRSATGTLYIVLQRYISSDVWLWESANNGATWSAPRKIYDWSNSTDFGEPTIGPAATEMTFTVANTADAVFAANISGSESAIATHADLNDPFSDLDYNLEAVPTGDGGMIAVESRLDSAYFWRMAPAGNPSLTAAWTSPPVLIGPTQEDAQVAGGPSGQFVLQTAADVMVSRKWNGVGFDPPVGISAERGYMNDLVVSGTGGVGAIWRRNGSPNQLRFALSTNAGATFATRTVSRVDDLFSDLDVGLANDNQGFYTYAKGNPDTGARDFIRVGDLSEVAAPIPPPPPPPPPPPVAAPNPAIYGYPGAIYTGPTAVKSSSDRDKKISLTAPRTCVRPGQKFRARLTWARKKRKGNLFVKVRRADFYINSKRVKIDTKAPFTQLLTVKASSTRGSTVRLRARAYIKVKRGKSPTKSLNATFKVCL